MTQDYYGDTAIRMCDSSKVLYQNNQWLNSCYLAGYVVECYGKRMVELGINDGLSLERTAQQYSHRINDLKECIKYMAALGASISSYCQDLSVICPMLVNGWNPFTLRYASDSHEWNKKESAEKVQSEIEKLIETIIQMQVDGVW